VSGGASAADVRAEIDALADPAQANNLKRFFKTGPGEYGEGDVFIGVKVPPLRKIARGYRDLPLSELDALLASPVHEHRTVALVIVTERSKRADAQQRTELYDFYLAHTPQIRNWDHVDISCPDVVGGQLLALGDSAPLKSLARSRDLWERRIAIVSTFKFIRAGELEPTFEVARLLLDDEQDLIHKAVGWMLREAGKKDLKALEEFLDRHARAIPRTSLRYAIERMPPERRAYWRSR
jgi:3-methyladenine DNA glycosylase AlkD